MYPSVEEILCKFPFPFHCLLLYSHFFSLDVWRCSERYYKGDKTRPRQCLGYLATGFYVLNH